MAVIQVLCVCPAGIIFLAPVCASWIWLTRGITKRSVVTPLGNTDIGFVHDANLMVSRVILLILLADAMGLTWLLEQPINSLLEWHPRFMELMQLHSVRRVSVNMSGFGALTMKPSWLYTCHRAWELLRSMAAYRTAARTGRTLVETSNGKVHGTPEMSTAQAYPVRFGEAVACVYASMLPELLAANWDDPWVVPSTLNVEFWSQVPLDAWADAHLEDVLRMVSVV